MIKTVELLIVIDQDIWLTYCNQTLRTLVQNLTVNIITRTIVTKLDHLKQPLSVQNLIVHSLPALVFTSGFETTWKCRCESFFSIYHISMLHDLPSYRSKRSLWEVLNTKPSYRPFWPRFAYRPKWTAGMRGTAFTVIFYDDCIYLNSRNKGLVDSWVNFGFAYIFYRID